MSAYRDSFAKCPRCSIALVDARSARGCSACGGLWIGEAVLAEMILEMLPPGALGPVHLAVLARDEPPIACPECGAAMVPTVLRGVPIDRCAKHGVWFDAHELGTALRRVGDPSAKDASIAPAGAAPPVTFRFRLPGQPTKDVRLEREVIKVGRLESAHLVLAHPSVARLHAVIEASSAAITLIDLGSSGGSWVNGAAVGKQALRPGDQLRFGEIAVEVTFAPG